LEQKFYSCVVYRCWPERIVDNGNKIGKRKRKDHQSHTQEAAFIWVVGRGLGVDLNKFWIRQNQEFVVLREKFKATANRCSVERVVLCTSMVNDNASAARSLQRFNAQIVTMLLML
jgi:hypothetical protein